MSRPGRFLFDECVGKPVMEALQAVVGPDAEFVHLVDRFGSGSKDGDWIPAAGTEGGWVVITSDGGKLSKRGHKLPELCRTNGVTHVVMSAKLAQQPSNAKVAALAAVWPELLATASEPPGTRFRLRIQQSRSLSVRVTVLLEKVDSPATDTPAE